MLTILIGVLELSDNKTNQNVNQTKDCLQNKNQTWLIIFKIDLQQWQIVSNHLESQLEKLRILPPEKAKQL